jgi:hypothetical protein
MAYNRRVGTEETHAPGNASLLRGRGGKKNPQLEDKV